jgi:predicted transcriptional regulator
MAMTLRFPPELDAALTQIADSKHTSKSALVLGALEAYVISETKAGQVMASVERTLVRDADLLTRLEDA